MGKKPGEKEGHAFHGNQFVDANKRAWAIRGTRDPRVEAAVNEYLTAAQSEHAAFGRELAAALGVQYDETVESSVQFYDSTNDIAARNLQKKWGGVFAITSPGSRAIRLPGESVARMKSEDARDLILHEVLHSHGLPEKDRSDADRITREVKKFMKTKRTPAWTPARDVTPVKR